MRLFFLRCQWSFWWSQILFLAFFLTWKDSFFFTIFGNNLREIMLRNRDCTCRGTNLRIYTCIYIIHTLILSWKLIHFNILWFLILENWLIHLRYTCRIQNSLSEQIEFIGIFLEDLMNIIRIPFLLWVIHL